IMIDKTDDTLLKILKFDPTSPLLFNTGLFLILFFGFLVIYSILRRTQSLKMVFVILFSLYFYYKSSAEYCFILLGVCLFDYVLGSTLGNTTKQWVRKLLVAINVIVNVGMLVYFKYFNLLFEAFANITSTRFDPLDIILPAGISFFTFRSISYIVDIYRREIEPCQSFLQYTFFLTFFPPLLAGPVVRAKDLLPQIKENPVADRWMTGGGFFLIICGLVKKVVIADYISGNFVDRIFDNPSLYTGFENLMGVYGFTLQLYCDFSGYSDMAIGIALLLGFRFKDNFDSPFKSQSPTEFWHRWHISLSTWLRDYLYIPLGGSRTRTKIQSHANLVTTMALGGLWHGASWMYVIWGFWNGFLLVLHKIYI
ncbi:MAG: MBOAT family protein, partial [Muribaculaceae bacterium]|nr:MBOAT family protein [Muribaculaceae bacterium]